MSGKIIPENFKECNLADRILLTLHLADRRGYGMCPDHISKMLIYGESNEEQVRQTLSSMHLVSHQNGIYCLKGSEGLLSETRRKLLSNGVIRERYEAEAMLFSTEYASLCPFIKCIAITGSMASGGFSEEDDIDFNIFTEHGCKYTTYLLGILLSIKYSVKHRKKSLARKSRTPFLPKLICINVIWEDEEAFPFVRQDKYMAYELLRQKPIMGLDFYKKILEKNSWLETFFPQICNKKSQEVETRRTSIARVLRLIYSNRVLSHLGERMCREISYLLWRYVQFSRRNNPEALSRVRWVTEMQKPYALFGDRI
ncbi:MAG: hypothetical protein MPEBLZ_00406 [Candidatus Methanoperedens nitroreducens]|uniref:Polymerase nucleotidyl transferase domain-containing protein n=1 Tax=Candidatus Methanoperedens nitratireducens TaxID=1392998 RepID=A0A0P8ADR2_9EURY|nr:hypothetical protein [Candidatus Methanoperedens sp. BLZ2]KAB2947087.1 MAG: hypothetical protein F9K14_05020 [Candidatus Methanoperedens sp.]KPQ45021.1 MAG: hypothetical protein MPEBLZ_00406 [Candidatus Methanoperedens sp. BLZ1]MBZ0174183.1 hypothetical protein [Candidatus Methanoperedens nitroreducens]MCX9077703.1 hypothetical protein [Candidatus Methanoperedens sp.]